MSPPADALPYGHDVSACLSDGRTRRGGASKPAYDAARAEVERHLDELRDLIGDRALPLFALPGASDDLAAIRSAAARLSRFGQVMVLGIGGSSLGGQALCAIAREGRPRVRFTANLDARDLALLLKRDNLADTGFVVISKSGGTPETVAEALVVIDALNRVGGGDMVADHMIAVTQPGDSPLRRLAARWALPILDHDPRLGGRYSVLSVVGLLPGELARLHIHAVREGAAAVLRSVVEDTDPAPAVGAALHLALQREAGVSSTVLMPYCDRLDRLAHWYRQLWAESVGKQGKGMTPIAALGPVDQHSQLQLWLDGPADKIFTLLLTAEAGRGPAIDVRLAGDDPDIAYLKGHSIGDLVAAEGRATTESLIANNRPTRVMNIKRPDEQAMGALFMHFMIETILYARAIGVDPFDQPAVEQGKRLTRAYLSNR